MEKLRKVCVKFCDGKPMTAEDIAYWALKQEEDTNNPGQWLDPEITFVPSNQSFPFGPKYSISGAKWQLHLQFSFRNAYVQSGLFKNKVLVEPSPPGQRAPSLYSGATAWQLAAGPRQLAAKTPAAGSEAPAVGSCK